MRQLRPPLEGPRNAPVTRPMRLSRSSHCLYCGIDEKAARNNHCIADIREQAPEMLERMASAVKIANPIHAFQEYPGIPVFFGRGAL